MLDTSYINQKKIFYSRGYKYQLREDYCIQLGIYPKEDIITDFLRLYKSGLLFFRKGYAWDGCSGPTWDDKTNMRGGLVHDGGYQLLRLGLLPQRYKAYFDFKFKEICLEDHMLKLRADYYYMAVNKWGKNSCSLGCEPYPILVAP